MVLRGIFLLRKKEIDWFYEGAAAAIYPDGILSLFSLLVYCLIVFEYVMEAVKFTIHIVFVKFQIAQVMWHVWRTM